MQEIAPYAPYLLAIGSTWIGYWWAKQKTPGRALANFKSIDAVIDTYTQRLSELTARITKLEMTLIDIRTELKISWEKIDELEKENQDLTNRLNNEIQS